MYCQTKQYISYIFEYGSLITTVLHDITIICDFQSRPA